MTAMCGQTEGLEEFLLCFPPRHHGASQPIDCAQPSTDLQKLIHHACRYRMSAAGRRQVLVAPGLIGTSPTLETCAPDQIPAPSVQPPQLGACSCAGREQEDWWEAWHMVSRQARSGPLTCPGLRAPDSSIARQVLQHAAALARVEVLGKRGFWPAGVRPPCRLLRHFNAVACFAPQQQRILTRTCQTGPPSCAPACSCKMFHSKSAAG